MSAQLSTFQFTETQDWFSHNIPHWTSLFPYITTPTPRVLEIGSWEGRSAVFVLNNLCKDGGEVICIDHFDLLMTEAGRARLDKVKHNLSLTGKEHRIMPQFSVPALFILLQEEIYNTAPGFDWIYIDGSHESDDTFLDGELCWRLARNGAIVIFDDYHWNKEPEDSIHHPKRGVDAFLTLHRGEYELLTALEHYQVVLRKTNDMRIGFLVGTPDVSCNSTNDPAEALGYGINVALVVDSSYAMAAAIVVRSAIDCTLGRITFFVVDCGLSSSEREKLQQSIPSGRSDATLKFVDIPDNALAREQGPVWAKVDMLRVLPVERCLYLDSDVLVRQSLKELWDMDLEGCPVAACVDIGHPLGHEGIERKPYFNAGVMLLNLAVIRKDIVPLFDIARKMNSSKYRDQDALNMHFGRWKSVNVKWNAQGLGTYAEYPHEDRKDISFDDMKDPAIVHFTGPVHPSLSMVLNPYVQPPTAKPWGYAGSPGHPFEHEWWAMLEETAWKGIEETNEWKNMLVQAKQKVIDDAAVDIPFSKLL